MSIVIRDVREHELDSVLALNNNAGLAILPLDSARLRRFYEQAEYFRVAERDGNLAGFLVGFGADAGPRQQQLRLVPRALPAVLLHRPHRGGQPPPRRWRGPRVLRRRAELRRAALSAAGLRSLPRPRRRPGPAVPWQLRLQARSARTSMPEADVRASMLMKELCSYPWVRETYGDALPDLPWARSRLHAPRQRATVDGYMSVTLSEHGLRTGRRTEDRPGRHRQPARAHPRRGQLSREMRERVERAPKLFGRAAGDRRFRRPGADAGRGNRTRHCWTACAAPACCRWRWPTARAKPKHLAEQLGLPLLAKFRAQYEPVAPAPAAALAPAARRESAAR